MNVVGLITEYNPFHNGHLYHLQEAKKITGADYAVVVMSGNFLQRGAPAIVDKHTRAAMALLNGADLVLELPVSYAAGSAEYFAMGAVSLLDKLGIVNSLCFGSECGDIDLLSTIAAVLLDEPKEYRSILQAHLKQGLSFPAARSNALLDYLSDSFQSSGIMETISNPNNILGIEYIKALKKRNSTIKPYTISRVSSGYHEAELKESISSATALRNSIFKNQNLNELRNQVPVSVYKLLEEKYQKGFPIYANDFSSILKYKLLSETSSSLTDYVDVSSDLALKIMNHLNQYENFHQFADLLKTKELTHSRITRVLFHILLDIKKESLETYIYHDYIQYFRILGFKKDSTLLLNGIKNSASIPMITKLADAKKNLSPSQYAMLIQDVFASDIYHTIVTDKFSTPFINEYSSQIIRVTY